MTILYCKCCQEVWGCKDTSSLVCEVCPVKLWAEESGEELTCLQDNQVKESICPSCIAKLILIINGG